MSSAAKKNRREDRLHAHFADAREDAMKLAAESVRVVYVRCTRSGYYASFEPGANPLMEYRPERLPSNQLCRLAREGWRTTRWPGTHDQCPGCGRIVYTRKDGTCAPHLPPRRGPRE